MRILLVASILGVSFLILFEGCDTKSNPVLDKPRFIIAMVDETPSFHVDTMQFWPELRSWVAQIVQRMEPGERFAIIGIDDHGFDVDDIRVPVLMLDENSLTASRQKREIIKTVLSLNRRPLAHPYTDIIGGLHQAANILKGQENYRAMIAIFSDMIQTPRFPTIDDAKDLSFPPDSHVYCFYVDATRGHEKVTGQESWNRIVSAWVPVFEAAGLNYQDENGNYYLYERGNTKIGFEIAFHR